MQPSDGASDDDDNENTSEFLICPTQPSSLRLIFRTRECIELFEYLDIKQSIF